MKLGNGYIVERPLQLVCDLEVGGEVERHALNPDAPEFNPRKAQVEEEREPRPGRRAKAIARDKIKSVAVHEDEEA